MIYGSQSTRKSVAMDVGLLLGFINVKLGGLPPTVTCSWTALDSRTNLPSRASDDGNLREEKKHMDISNSTGQSTGYRVIGSGGAPPSRKHFQTLTGYLVHLICKEMELLELGSVPNLRLSKAHSFGALIMRVAQAPQPDSSGEQKWKRKWHIKTENLEESSRYCCDTGEASKTAHPWEASFQNSSEGGWKH